MSYISKLLDDPFSPTKVNFRVWPLDMDINIHMNNARYLSMMDLGRIYHMARAGLLKYVLKHKWMPVVAQVEMRYIRSIGPFEKYTLQSEITGYDEKYFYMKQTFIRHDKEVAIGVVKGLFLDKKGRKIPSKEVLSYLPQNIK